MLIPGGHGALLFVLVGTEKAMKETFGSTCHGAGRVMSRHQALKVAQGRSIVQELEAKGHLVQGAGRGTIDEEISEAYKDVSMVVDVCHGSRHRQKGGEAEALGGD